jgi:carbon monoxide dehydrogenase subunit G
MATIRKEICIDAPADAVWDAVHDVGAIHTRFVPGFVTNTVIEEGARVVTFASGLVVRELIVDVDETMRRLAYAVIGSELMRHHHATFEVLAEGAGRCRLIWVADLLPHEAAGPVGAMMAEGARIMQSHLSRDGASPA